MICLLILEICFLQTYEDNFQCHSKKKTYIWKFYTKIKINSCLCGCRIYSYSGKNRFCNIWLVFTMISVCQYMTLGCECHSYYVYSYKIFEQDSLSFTYNLWLVIVMLVNIYWTRFSCYSIVFVFQNVGLFSLTEIIFRLSDRNGFPSCVKSKPISCFYSFSLPPL